jgi:hypothetical protein
VRAKQVFESVFGPPGRAAAATLTDADIKAADDQPPTTPPRPPCSAGLPGTWRRAPRELVGAWQDHLIRLVEAEDTRPRPGVSFDERH